jgi:hypothetical protein
MVNILFLLGILLGILFLWFLLGKRGGGHFVFVIYDLSLRWDAACLLQLGWTND